MKGIRKMDEMELQITLRAAVPPGSSWCWPWWSGRCGRHFTEGTLPARLPAGGPGNDFCLVQWIDRARAGDDRVKREFVLWVILTVALLTFSLLLVLGG